MRSECSVETPVADRDGTTFALDEEARASPRGRGARGPAHGRDRAGHGRGGGLTRRSRRWSGRARPSAPPRRSGARETMTINMGPQHPSHPRRAAARHRAGRRDRASTSNPVIGYLHTGIEKQCENKTYFQAITLITGWTTSRRSPTTWPTTVAVEKLLGVEVPPRAQCVRVLLAELNRISSHLVWLGTTRSTSAR